MSPSRKEEFLLKITSYFRSKNAPFIPASRSSRNPLRWSRDLFSFSLPSGTSSSRTFLRFTMPPPSFVSPAPLRLARAAQPARQPRPRYTVCGASRHQRPAIRPKQSLSQTFLTCPNTISKIVNIVREASPKTLIEVGPGLGALTIPLYEEYPKMRAIEIDQRAIEQLQKTIPVDIIHEDVLNVQWENLGSDLTVIGNLPYHITSQILFSLFETNVVNTAIVMMQKEVAQRVVSKTHSKNYGILSVVSQLYSQPELLMTIPSNAFYPVPKVESAIVKFAMKPKDGFDISDIALGRKVKKVLKAGFGQRRKVLRNSLRGVIDVPEKVEACRAEEIDPMGFVELARLVDVVEGSGGIWR